MSTTALVRPLAHHKIHGSHDDRLAAVSVRQSTPQQMIRHQESTRWHYGLVLRFTNSAMVFRARGLLK